ELDEALARSYLETYQLRAAEAVIDRWLRISSGDPRPYLWRAEVGKRTAADPETLARDYRAALGIDPGNRTARLGLGEAFLELDRHDEALPLFETAVLANPDDAEARLGLGRALGSL